MCQIRFFVFYCVFLNLNLGKWYIIKKDLEASVQSGPFDLRIVFLVVLLWNILKLFFFFLFCDFFQPQLLVVTSSQSMMDNCSFLDFGGVGF